MPTFRVYRYKRYEATVEAPMARFAPALALDVPGKDWRLVEDKVENEVRGLDGAVQLHGDGRDYEDPTS